MSSTDNPAAPIDFRVVIVFKIFNFFGFLLPTLMLGFLPLLVPHFQDAHSREFRS